MEPCKLMKESNLKKYCNIAILFCNCYNSKKGEIKKWKKQKKI